ncbi:MAG: ATP-binding protein [Acidobacteria bacterium]|nr:ATP-binding protein [Acidobacteriota bacterium]
MQGPANGPVQVNPRDLDLVELEGEYVLYAGPRPLVSPRGIPLAHSSRRVAEHVFREILCAGAAEFAPPTGCALLEALRLPGALPPPPDDAGGDPLLPRPTRVPDSPPATDPAETLAFIDTHAEALPLACTGAAVAADARRRLSSLLAPEGKTLPGAVRALRPEALAAVSLLGAAHGAGLALPLLLVEGRLTPSEYAHALYGLHSPLAGRSPDDRPVSTAPGPEAPRAAVDWEYPATGLARLRAEAANLVELLGCLKETGDGGADLAALVRGGESEHLEFKSTLRFNLHAGKNDPAIEHAALKSVAAFLNTDGGDLLLGVDDDGTVLGLEADRFLNDDHLARHFWNLVKTALGQDLAPFVRTRFEETGGRKVFRVTCRRGPRPVFLVQKGAPDEFYIRIGPSSEKLGIQEALRYTAHRF